MFAIFPLMFIAPMLIVSITPTQITVIDAPLHNNFSLTCTATSSGSSTSATKAFTWSKGALGSSSSTPLTHNGGSVVIVTSGDTSTLSTSETQSGGYVYTCSASVGGGAASSATAHINVRGSYMTLYGFMFNAS